MSKDKKIQRIWKPIDFNEKWGNADTSILDDLSASWFSRREVLAENPESYNNFLEELKREHAIETGVIEGLYDIRKGVTETLIKHGFVDSYVSHGDTNIDKTDLFAHLNDHVDAVNLIFDLVKDDHRPFGTSFIKELHSLTTRNQKHAEGRDQFGNKLKIELLKGKFKIRENNPTASDGTVIMYCPPEHVDAEMEKLVAIYKELITKEIHPLIIATWLHHAFVCIHPFQDGNGRVARLLTSMVLIKNGLFPFTVPREEAKVKYIDALEKADLGEIQALVDYFGSVQKRNIERALNVQAVVGSSFDEVQDIFAKKINELEEEEKKKKNALILQRKIVINNRKLVLDYSYSKLKELKIDLLQKINGNSEINISEVSFSDNSNFRTDSSKKRNNYLHNEILKYSNKFGYQLNENMRKAWILFRITISKERKYAVFFSFHHYGYGNSVLAIGAFILFKNKKESRTERVIPIEMNPHIISLDGDVSLKQTNINKYLENVMTVALAKIASEL